MTGKPTPVVTALVEVLPAPANGEDHELQVRVTLATRATLNLGPSALDGLTPDLQAAGVMNILEGPLAEVVQELEALTPATIEGHLRDMLTAYAGIRAEVLKGQTNG